MKQTLLCVISIFIFSASYGQLPYSGCQPQELLKSNGFIENKGQVKDQNGRPASNVRYIFSDHNFNLILKDNGFSYELLQHGNNHPISEANGVTIPVVSDDEDALMIPETHVKMERFDAFFLNASGRANIVGKERLSYNNYYQGNSSAFVQVPSYKKVCYQNIYPGIDLIFKVPDENDSHLEYQYIVHPGAKVSAIQVEYKTDKRIELKDGSIVIPGKFGYVKEENLFCYQNDKHVEVPSGFSLKGNILSFNLKDYDSKSTLVIDPDLIWGTYYGGEGDEQFNQEVAVDDADNVVLAGTTNSTTGIASAGAYQITFGGSPTDLCIAKFNSSGTLQWSTFFGGDDQDIDNSVAVDHLGNIIVAGNSKSSNITTPGAYQEDNAGAGDILLSKFDTSGQLLWSTLYGGSLPDQARSVCTDNNNDIYIASYGNSPNGISTTGVYQETYGGAGDAYISKFSAAGFLLWGSYFSGPGQDRAHTVCVDEMGAVYISGTVESTTGIASAGAHQTTLGGGTDAFLAKFDTSNGHLFWATYYGGEADEHGRNVEADGAGNIYIDGYTMSKVNISTPDSYQPEISIQGGGDTVKYSEAYLAKFTTNGNRIWGTYYGGYKSEECFGLTIDPLANVYLAGSTTSENSIATSDAYQDAIASTTDQDGFFAQMDSAGHRLYGTYLGGLVVDEIYDLDADMYGNLFVTARTDGNDMPVTAYAYQSTNNGNSDYTLYKFSLGIANGELDQDHIQSPQNYISLYPNPASGQLNINLSDKVKASDEILICDLQGKVLIEKELQNANSLSLNVSELEEGMYLIRIRTLSSSEQQLFLIQR